MKKKQKLSVSDLMNTLKNKHQVNKSSQKKASPLQAFALGPLF